MVENKERGGEQNFLSGLDNVQVHVQDIRKGRMLQHAWPRRFGGFQGMKIFEYVDMSLLQGKTTFLGGIAKHSISVFLSPKWCQHEIGMALSFQLALLASS